MEAEVRRTMCGTVLKKGGWLMRLGETSLTRTKGTLFFFGFRAVGFCLLDFGYISCRGTVPAHEPGLLGPSALCMGESPLFMP